MVAANRPRRRPVVTIGAKPLTASWASRLAVIALLVSVAGVAFIVAFDVLFLTNGRSMEVVFSLLPLFLIIDLSGVGGLLVIRRPGNAIGALLLFAGFCTAVAWGGGYYVQLDELLNVRLPLVVPIGWLSSWVFTPTFGLLVVFLPMLYPSGHLPGPRWRIVAAIALVAITIGAISNALAPAPSNDAIGQNTMALPEPFNGILQTLGSLSLLLAPPIIAISIGGLISRFRRSRGVERQQMKWFLSVATMAAFAIVVSIVTTGPLSDAAWILGMIAIGCVPLAIGVAILRYRLYEIDRLVSRTISYAVITAVLVVVFGAFNLVLEAVLATLTQASTLAVAGSTLLVFALFQPLRRRVQAAVDRRFDRERYEGDRIARAFAERLRDEVDPERLRDEIDRVLAQTVAPVRTVIWLRGERAGRS
jgi:hypothetical protein